MTDAPNLNRLFPVRMSDDFEPLTVYDVRLQQGDDTGQHAVLTWYAQDGTRLWRRHSRRLTPEEAARVVEANLDYHRFADLLVEGPEA